ncbi:MULTISPECIES: class I SAM-dependent rRNA methyltransferase [unclassified Aureispira]|uniref:class I SAM-dependent rRNA methyltransferase n=1 Tax=unclassified Aureispira TaxID=2649989 RepID=UPI0006961F4A|nr:MULTISPECIES: class I SAM-dependent rRNA methyltransferase [unclassified Aureispira]WMX17422.1 class I SAM-dependent rRNA methyltransferase [Aureispira sp. CCB-E]
MDNSIIKIHLKNKKDTFVRRFHPWIFSGAIARKEGVAKDGSIAEVYSRQGDFLAMGHYHEGSIAIKIFSFEKIVPDADFWYQKLQAAFDMRQKIGLVDLEKTAFRLVHGEGDGLPGLIVDVYNKTVVVQAHTIGMHLSRHLIAEGLQRVFGDRITGIYDKSKNSLPKDYAQSMENGPLWGESIASDVIIENGCQFEVNWETGQKTGFFLDQRDNRNLLRRFCKDKKVLNAFCYSGGFSVYALQAGASEVHSVDASAKAIELVEKNVALNGFASANHQSYKADVLQFLKDKQETYDVMVLDPPAYAKTVAKRHKAIQAYKRLNIEGLKLVKKGGILLTFSCSQVVDNQLFYNTITAAAIEAKRKVRVLHRLTQPADHPVNIFHPEGNYLKGLVLYVE